jgi:hypothetical protein
VSWVIIFPLYIHIVTLDRFETLSTDDPKEKLIMIFTHDMFIFLLLDDVGFSSGVDL